MDNKLKTEVSIIADNFFRDCLCHGLRKTLIDHMDYLLEEAYTSIRSEFAIQFHSKVKLNLTIEEL